MSRFGDYSDDLYFNNQGDFWWANIERALSGRRGQVALRELEAALVELPEPKLISGHLSMNGQVCAVGALVARRRCAKGESRDAVLQELERLIPIECAHCYHAEESHQDGTCSACEGRRRAWEASHDEPYRWLCPGFEPSDESYGDGELRTAEAGVSVGLTYSLAWRLSYLNDEDFEGLTPEERYERVLAWVRGAIIEESAVA
jgi:hypothetical protein